MLDTPYPSIIPGPPRPSRILTPRDLERHHGRERHLIPGGGALMLRLGAGDRLTVVNDEGGQIAELSPQRPRAGLMRPFWGRRQIRGPRG